MFQRNIMIKHSEVRKLGRGKKIRKKIRKKDREENGNALL